MKHFSATEAKNRFGELLEEAGKEPVIIEKNGRDYRVVLSAEQFQHLLSASNNIDTKIQTSLERSLKRWAKTYEALAK